MQSRTDVKLFFETHGRFPSQQEFCLIKQSMQGEPPKDAAISPHNPQELFIDAAKAGNLEECRRLMPLIRSIDAAPPVPGYPERTRGTALCLAAQGDHINVVKFLLDMKASIDSRPSQNRTALLYAAESGHFNTMNYLISRGATYFTYSDQQIESYYISYTIRQSITRRELSYVLPGEILPGIVLDYLGLGGQRIRPIERLAPLSVHNKSAYGARPIPNVVVSPIPSPPPIPDPSAITPIYQRKRTDIPSSSTTTTTPGASVHPGMLHSQQQQQQQHIPSPQQQQQQQYVSQPVPHQQPQEQAPITPAGNNIVSPVETPTAAIPAPAVVTQNNNVDETQQQQQQEQPMDDATKPLDQQQQQPQPSNQDDNTTKETVVAAGGGTVEDPQQNVEDSTTQQPATNDNQDETQQQQQQPVQEQGEDGVSTPSPAAATNETMND